MGNTSPKPQATRGASFLSNGGAVLREVTDRLFENGEHLLVNGRYHRGKNRLRKDYLLTQQVLGMGINGNVLVAQSRRNGQRYAVKSFDFRRFNSVSLRDMASEMETMLVADHPNIVRVADVYETETSLHMVMECMEGGELFDRLVMRSRFEEDDAAVALRQMFSAVAYLHGCGIVHRDVKPENFLYEAQGGSFLKLTDFGFARYWDPSVPMSDRVGTPAYGAPEVAARSYTSQCDVWSLGVIAFMLIAGYSPFKGSAKQQAEDINCGRYKWRDDYWKNVSPDATDFVKSLLVCSPSLRPTALDALQNPWLAKGRSTIAIPAALHIRALQGLQQYRNSSKFRRACLAQMARSMNCTDFAQARSYFLGVGSLHGGTMTVRQLTEAAHANNDFSEEEVCDILKELDAEQVVNYTDFLAAMIPIIIRPRRSLLVDSFSRFDHDAFSGTANLDREHITHRTLQSAFRIDKTEAQRLLLAANCGQAGRLFFADFQKLVECPSAPVEFETSSNTSSCIESQSKSWLGASWKKDKSDRFGRAKHCFTKLAAQFADVPESFSAVVEAHPANSLLQGGWGVALP